jgi:hypothetical protein
MIFMTVIDTPLIDKKFYWNDEEGRFIYDLVIWDKGFYS